MLTHYMQPKINADTCYIQIPDGVYLRGNHGGLVLKGKSLYLLLEHLVPNLTGNTTLQEITEGLDTDKKRMITRLIEKLLTHRFLQDVSQQQLHTLHPTELATYSSAITFIEAFQSSSAHRFEQFRNQHLLIIGSEPTFTALVQASLQCGVRYIDGIITPTNDFDLHQQQDSEALFSPCDPEQIVQLLDTFPWDDEAAIQSTIQAYDAVLHVTDQSMLARARLLNRICVEQQRILLQTVIVHDHAWIGPLVRSDTIIEGGCWECAWLRLQSQHIHRAEDSALHTLRDSPVDGDKHENHDCQSLATPTAMMLAYRLTFMLFTYCTQIDSTENRDKLTEINLKTFLSETHTFLPHPCCTACQHPLIPTAEQFIEHIQRLQQQEPLKADTFLEKMARCIDSKTGIFAERSDLDFVQIPLAVQAIAVSHPLPVLDQHEHLTVIATSIDAHNARLRVCKKACERYASRMVDQRRLFPHEIVQQRAIPTVSIDSLPGMKPLQIRDGLWTWALNMHTQQAHLLPAAHAFAAPDEQHPTSEHERGIASGWSWEEAICHALVDWCNYLTIVQVMQTHSPYRQVDLARTLTTSVGRHLYHLLTTAGCQVTVYDITGTLHVPTFAICSGEQVIAYGTHCDVEEALKSGLEQALQRYQAEQFQQPEYTTDPVPNLPTHLHGEQLYVPCYTPLPNTWSARMEWLLQQFQANGWRVFALPLDHDPALAQVLPYIVRLLLTCTDQDNNTKRITLS